MAHVLVVDDERGLRVSLQMFLKNDGHTVKVAENTFSAIEMIEQHNFDVVVSDVVMPRESGMSLLEYIYNNHPHIKTIMMTGEPTIKTTVLAMRHGAFDFVAKPVSGKDLCKVVNEAARKKAELDKSQNELEETRARYRRITENAKDMIWQSDHLGTLNYINRASLNVLGYTPEECIGMTAVQYLTRDSYEQLSKWLRDANSNPYSNNQIFMELEMVHKNGSVISCEINSTLIRDKNGNTIAMEGITRDVSERKISEDNLRRSEAKFRNVFESAGIGMSIGNMDGSFIQVNKAFCNIFGYDEGELIGMSQAELTHPDDLEYDTRQLIRTLTVENNSYQRSKRFIHKNGKIIDGIVNVSIARDQDGNPLYMMSQIQDITKQKQAEAERRKMQEGMNELQRVDSLTNMAGGVGHDLNNLLTGIIGNTDLILMDLKPDSEFLDSIKDIEKSAMQAADLARQMLAYSGNNRMNTEKCNFTTMAQSMNELLESSTNPKIKLEFNLQDSIPDAKADTGQLQQALANLVSNAAESIGNASGKIIISTGTKMCNKEYLANTHLNDNLNTGEYAFLEVRDTGCGIDAKDMKNIFDPFYTSKINGRGLGLPATLGIVRAHSGAIKVESELEQGTSITILLPVPTKQKAKKTQFPVNTNIPGKTSDYTILVADDEEIVRRTAKRALKKAGMNVITAVDGQDTIDVYKKHVNNIDLILLDKTMPKLDGYETLIQLLEINPAQKVLIASGYQETEIRKQFDDYDIAGFIQKPYMARTLVKTVCQLLGCTSCQNFTD